MGLFVNFLNFLKLAKVKAEILETKNFTQDVSIRLSRIVTGDGQGKRTDRLQTTLTGCNAFEFACDP